MTHDNAIARLFTRLLLKDSRLSSRRIQVSVREGFVHLQGRVCSAMERKIAADLASTLPGVRGIHDELAIMPPAALPDAIVAEHVRRALESHPRVVKEAITVAVLDGAVILSGTVSGDEERWLALDIALGVDGARSVQDVLTVDPVRRIEDVVLARGVKEAILHALGDPQARIRVAISGGTAVLSGTLATEAQKRAAEDAAHTFALGGLRNEIQVEGNVNGGPRGVLAGGDVSPGSHPSLDEPSSSES